MARKRNYVNNPDFYAALKEYQESCREAESRGEERPDVPRYIGECIWHIANRYSTKPNFYYYSYRDEMIADGLDSASRAILKFDPAKSDNPFAYFTQIIKNAFIQRIKTEQKEVYIKYKVTENSIINGATFEGSSGDSEDLSSHESLTGDYIADFVNKYENRIREQTEKRKKKVGLEEIYDED